MKRSVSLLATLFAALASPALAGSGYWHEPGYWSDLECQWARESPAIQASLDASNAQIALPRDSQLQAATLRQFSILDAQTLARYNQGIAPTPSGHRPARPSR